MGRANRQSGGGAGLRETASEGASGSLLSNIKEMENILGASFSGLEINSEIIDAATISYHFHQFQRATNELISKGDMESLATVMERFDPSFKKDQFLGEVLDENGKFAGATKDDYEAAVREEMEKRLWSKEGAGGRTEMAKQKIEQTIEASIDEVMADPQWNRIFRPKLNEEYWAHQENVNKISEAWERAGGSRDILHGSLDPAKVFAASANLRHGSDVEDITSYNDEGSEHYFIEDNPISGGAIYGDRRSYNMVIDDEDRTVNVEEVRNQDGHALKINSHGVEVSVVCAANLDEDGNPVINYDIGGGSQRATSGDLEASASLENLGLSLLRQKIEARKNPSSQSERLFDEIS